MTDANTSIIDHLFRAWDTVVLERAEGTRFRVIGTPPQWLTVFVEDPQCGAEIEPGRVFPYLETFLPDAEAFWDREEDGRLDADPWIETDPDGREWPLLAASTWAHGHALLTLQHMGQAFKQLSATMQVARDNLLTQERLELEVQKRTRSIREREEELVFRLLAAAGFRNEETGAHIRRIGLYSGQMAEELGWHLQDVEDIRLAASMHDVGKIGVPDKILLKAGPLTEDELAIMRTHAEIGGKMLEGSEIPLLQMSAEIARCHHERWDGQGYPAGLAGTDIPESARIVAIVDVYDAMVHERVYKPAIPEDEVLETLRAESGKHFDPRMVEVFLARLPQMREICGALQDEPPTWDGATRPQS